MLTHPAHMRKQRADQAEQDKLKEQDELDKLKAIAALQGIIAEALAGKHDRASLVAKVAAWVERACFIKAHG